MRYRKLGTEVYDNFKLEGASSDDPCVGNYQPGGIALYIGGNTVGRICKSGMGASRLRRWAYVCLNGQCKKKIWVIREYRNGNNRAYRDETAYQQQQWLLIQQGHENPDPNTSWDKDMKDFLNQISSSDNIILAKDANGSIEAQIMNEFLTSTMLLDAISSTHGRETPPTYMRGGKTIDVIFVTPGILEAMLRC
eukprot:707187-Ditylum_brightwellii.AAC.1